MKSIVIIILTHNSLDDATKPCLTSVLTVKSNLIFDVIVVDNDSCDGTKEYLISQEPLFPNLKIHLSDNNDGYAAGNNIGINTIKSDFYILLNNDTVVTDYWLDKLVRFWDEHPEVGMVGPVTNSVGNEQLIHTTSRDQDSIIAEGLSWARRCHGDYFFTSVLGFFCVAIKKEVINDIGLLDEDFGIGTFEDNDFCRRAVSSGHKLACVEDVFIFHKGSVTFKQSKVDMNALFFTNLRRYEEKNSVTWESGHNVNTFLGLFEHYLKSTSIDDFTKTIFKLENKILAFRALDYPDVYRKYMELLKLHGSHENAACGLEQQVKMLSLHLREIESSHTWKMAKKIHRVIDKFIFLYRRICGLASSENISAGTKIQPKHDVVIVNQEKEDLDYILKQNANKTIIVFPPLIDWRLPLFQRPQHIALQLAKHGFLYFYCTRNSGYDNVNGLERLSEGCYLTNRMDLILAIDQPKVIHLYSTDLATPPDFVFNEMRMGSTILYEYMDEIHPSISNAEIPSHTVVKHNAIINDDRCIVIATADKLYKEVLARRSYNCTLVTNGVDLSHFSKKFVVGDTPAELLSIITKNKVIIGYFGALASWFDYELLIKIAEERPNFELVIIGLS